mgnify:FL=1
MVFNRLKIYVSIYLFLLISVSLIGQEINQSTSQDSSISKLLKLKTDYNKRMYNSSYYTIQIYYGNLSEADSILKVFSEEFEEISTNLIFETPNYKVRVGIFKTFIDASKGLEKIKRKFSGAFILKDDEL